MSRGDERSFLGKTHPSPGHSKSMKMGQTIADRSGHPAWLACVFASLIVLLLSGCSRERPIEYADREIARSSPQRSGVIPNSEAAIEVAEARLQKIYDKSSVIRKRPYTARLEGEVWVVVGVDPEARGPNSQGGTFEVRVSKLTGKVIEIRAEK